MTSGINAGRVSRVAWDGNLQLNKAWKNIKSNVALKKAWKIQVWGFVGLFRQLRGRKEDIDVCTRGELNSGQKIQAKNGFKKSKYGLEIF